MPAGMVEGSRLGMATVVVVARFGEGRVRLSAGFVGR